MRTTVARRAILILSLMALLFSIDAAFTAELSVGAVTLLIVAGIAFARWIVHLAERALHESPEHRWGALVGLNVTGVVPALIAFGMVQALAPSQRAWAARATLAWIAAIAVWTTMVILGAPAQHIPAARPPVRLRASRAPARAAHRHAQRP